MKDQKPLAGCPFCGSEPSIQPHSRGNGIFCANKECGLFDFIMTRKEWETRYVK